MADGGSSSVTCETADASFFADGGGGGRRRGSSISIGSKTCLIQG